MDVIRSPKGYTYSVHHGPWTDTVPRVHGCMNPAHAFSNMKIILNILEKSHSFANEPLVFEFYSQISPSPSNLAFCPLHSLQITNPFHQSPYNLSNMPMKLPNYNFSPLNFFLSYLFNHNSESGDFCAKILRITTSFSSIYLYSYDYCI
jgi:hypothetical protein